MVRFIVEVDEDYIRQRAEPANLEAKKEKSGASMIGSLVQFMSFQKLSRDIGDGDVDFYISEDSLDPKTLDVFEHTVADLGILATIAKKDED